MLDLDGSGRIDNFEFSKALEDMGIDLTKSDITSLFKSFDKTNSGTIVYDDFIKTIKGFLSNFRQGVIARVFK